MNGRKKIIIIMIVLFGLLMTTGVSTWIITSQVTFAPEFLDVTVVNLNLPNLEIEIDYGELENNTRDSLKEKVFEKATQVIDVNGEVISTAADLVFQDSDGNVVTWSELGVSSITVDDLTLDDGNDSTENSQYAVGSTYLCTFDITFTNNNKYSLSTPTCIAKYKTCKADDGKWYTIEDALAKKDNVITLQSGDTDLQQHAFCNLSKVTLSDARFSNFLSNYKKEEKKSYVIDNPSLTLPYDTSGNTNGINSTSTTAAYEDANKVYLRNELLVPTDMRLTNNGVILVGGITTGGSGGHINAGRTSGNYAQITLDKNARIESYGDVESRGFIVEKNKDNGSSLMMNQGALKIPFTVMEHRGGTAFSSYKSGSNLKSSPFNRFFLENVNCKLTVKHTSKLIGLANLYAGSQNNPSDIHLIGNDSESLLQLRYGAYIEAKYDGFAKNKDNTANAYYQKTKLDIYGNMTVNSLSLPLSLGSFMGMNMEFTLDTKSVFFPIAWYYDITLNSINNQKTTVTATYQDIKLLPGSSLTVGKNVTLNAAAFIVYEDFTAEGYTDDAANGGNNFIQSGTAAMQYDKNKGNANFVIKGTLNVQELGGFISASADNAVINIEKASNLKSNETLSQSDTEITWQEITLNAKGDSISYVKGNEIFQPDSNTFNAESYRSVEIKGADNKSSYYWANYSITATNATDNSVFKQNIEPGLALGNETFYDEGYMLSNVNVAGNSEPIYTYGETEELAVKMYCDFTVTVERTEDIQYFITYITTSATGSGDGGGAVTKIGSALTDYVIGRDVSVNSLEYKFLGWSTSSDGTKDSVFKETDRLSIDDFDLTTKALNLYAVWDRLYHVEFDFGDIEYSEYPEYLENLYYDFGDDDDNPIGYQLPDNPQIGGYEFLGWKNSNGDSVDSIDKSLFENADENRTITLTADWHKYTWIIVNLTKCSIDSVSNATEFSHPSADDDTKYYYVVTIPEDGLTITINVTGDTSDGWDSPSISPTYEKQNFTPNNTDDKGTISFVINKNTPSETDITVTAKWKASGCVADGTLITLADGSQKKVEDLTVGEMLLVWNVSTGQFEASPILFIDKYEKEVYDIINLLFSDGTAVKVIYEHGFYDCNLNKYVYIYEDNASEFIGHEFLKQSYDENGNMIQTKVTLTGVEMTQEYTNSWSPVTYKHLVYYVEGMLSMPSGIEGLFNIFEIDGETYTIDKEQMAVDIEKYGLFTYEEFNAILPLNEVMFEVFNGKYLKVAIGKGLITWERLEYLANRYGAFFEQ